MIGRATLGRPWLFSQAAALLAGEPIPPDPTLATSRSALLFDHYRQIVERFGRRQGHHHDAAVRLLLRARVSGGQGIPRPDRPGHDARPVRPGRTRTLSARQPATLHGLDVAVHRCPTSRRPHSSGRVPSQPATFARKRRSGADHGKDRGQTTTPRARHPIERCGNLRAPLPCSSRFSQKRGPAAPNPHPCVHRR